MTTGFARFLVALLAAGFTATVSAQSYPVRQVRIIVPYTAGGTTDIVARIMAQKLTEAFGQQVLVENRPGGGGNTGSDLVAKAPPDGYALLMGSNGPLAANATLFKKMPFDGIKDFAAVTLIADVPNMLVIHPSLPVRNLKDFIAFVRARPGKLNFGSTGNGTAAHLTGELFKQMAKLDALHIPFKGAEALTAVMGGEVEFMFSTMPPAIPLVKGGKLKALGVSSAKRSAAMPELVTMSEAGLPGFQSSAWYGIVVPAATPRPIIDRLNTEILKILKQADVRERMIGQGAEPVGNSPEEFGAYIKSETVRWGKVIQISGAKTD